MDTEVAYTLSIVDNITPTVNHMLAQENTLKTTITHTNTSIKASNNAIIADQATVVRVATAAQGEIAAGADNATSSQQNLKQSIDNANKSIDSQNINFLTQLAAVTAVYGGMNMVSRGLETFGLVSDKGAEKLRKVSAAVGIMAGSFNMIRGAVKLVTALKNAEVVLAAVETYRAVLKNPAMLATVAIAGGAAGAVGGYMIGKGSGGGANAPTNSVTQNFTFSGGSQTDQRTMSRDVLEMMGG